MLPRTVAPGLVCQGPVYEIKGERAVMLSDLLVIMGRARLLAEIGIGRDWSWICRAARYQGHALWVSSRITLFPVNNLVGFGRWWRRGRSD